MRTPVHIPNNWWNLYRFNLIPAVTRRYIVAPCGKNTLSSGLEVLKGHQNCRLLSSKFSGALWAAAIALTKLNTAKPLVIFSRCEVSGEISGYEEGTAALSKAAASTSSIVWTGRK